MFREQFWPRKRPFWIEVGKRIESCRIIKSIHMTNSKFMGFQIGTQPWEMRKKCGESDLMIKWFEDLMIQIISRHRWKWPISRPKFIREIYEGVVLHTLFGRLSNKKTHSPMNVEMDTALLELPLFPESSFLQHASLELESKSRFRANGNICLACPRERTILHVCGS